MTNLMKSVVVDEIEFYKEKDKISVSELARLCNVSHQSISRLVKNYYSDTDFERGKDNSKLVPKNIVENIIYNYITKGHKVTNEAYNFVEFKFLRKNIKSNQTENNVRNKLQEQLGGDKEVITSAGNIDLLTSLEIIEVKHIRSWKHALGQILVYSKYYPSHSKRIHLFGKTTTEYKNLINEHCSLFNILVTWEN